MREVAACWAAAARAGRDAALSVNSRSAEVDAALFRAAARRTPLDAAKRASAPGVRPDGALSADPEAAVGSTTADHEEASGLSP